MNLKDKKEIMKEVKRYGQENAKKILGNDLPNNFINQFLKGKSLFSDLIEKTIELTEEKVGKVRK